MHIQRSYKRGGGGGGGGVVDSGKQSSALYKVAMTGKIFLYCYAVTF